MACAMKLKFDKDWGDSNLLISIAAILDPRNKMKSIEFCFSYIYHPLDVANEHIVAVRKSLYDIYDEYVTAHTLSTIKKTTQGDERDGGNQYGAGKCRVSGRSKFDIFISSVDSIDYIKSELDV
ncbi:DUF4413 domain-containing protein [Cephalotus follicularis]|uniref:DUF4413 domain-containing protein n=1 Tax=Cephalotus follicularis TaxID=3775 RepID=A0A1Q3CVG3_CEPFO|nr:DUF4413 domain-containing protein [Cephalotus follicularis]